MAGGKGSRLFPLTLDRAKPAVPFGGRYRIIDFVLSNLANSGVRSVYVLTQYKSQSLAEHVQRTWGARRATTPSSPSSRRRCAWASVVPRHGGLGVPEHSSDRGVPWGRRPGLRRGPHLQDEHPPDDRLPLPEGGHGDDRLPAHQEVGGQPVRHRPGRRQGRIVGFQEKPEHDPVTIPGDPEHCLGSMGNYVFAPGPAHRRAAAPTPSASRTTTSAATSCRRWSSRGRCSPTTSASIASAASPTRWRTPTGATWGPSTPTTRPTWTSRTSSPA